MLALLPELAIPMTLRISPAGDVTALRLFSVVALPTILLAIVRVGADASIPLSEVFVAMEPMELSEIVPSELLLKRIPNVVPRPFEEFTTTEFVLVPAPIVLPLIVQFSGEP